MGKKTKKQRFKAKKRAEKRLKMRTSVPQSILENPLLNLTQEPFQLTRLHYHLINHQEIPRIFSKLRCMDYDADRNRWLWLYQAESKKLKFKASYRDIPKARHPVILGVFCSDAYHQMYLDITSLDRARKAVLFFNAYLDQAVAEITDIELLQKTFEHDQPLPIHDDYFAESRPDKGTSDLFIRNHIAVLTNEIEDPQKKLEVVLSQIESLEAKG